MAEAGGLAIERLVIERLGAQGDGVAETPAGPVFVPLALPGETWQRTERGFARFDDGPEGGGGGEARSERPPAPCPHFGACGGCMAQHMGDDLYRRWKAGLVGQALAQHGIEAAVGPMWQAAPGSRRRVVLSADLSGDGGVALGFRAAGSHDLAAIDECVIAVAAIVERLPAIRALLAAIVASGVGVRDLRVHVLAADNGIDVWVEGVSRGIGAAARQGLARQAEGAELIRLRVGSDDILQRAHPVLRIGGVDVRVPPGAFHQAVAAAEHAMAEIVVRAVGRAKRVADLFAGLGAFTLPLARRARVFAVDNQAEAIDALGEAYRHTQGLKPVERLRRDLFREPLSRGELAPFEAVVFDPPRAGAAAQAAALARSKVPVVVAVSCNPATLARDLALLVEGGYGIDSVTPIDQFLYSAHVEAVAVLRR